jgi:hypothetical protein
MAETEARNQPGLRALSLPLPLLQNITLTLSITDPAATGPVSITITRNDSAITDDPFVNQRSADNDPFAQRRGGDALGSSLGSLGTSPKRDRRLSKEWGVFNL